RGIGEKERDHRKSGVGEWELGGDYGVAAGAVDGNDGGFVDFDLHVIGDLEAQRGAVLDVGDDAVDAAGGDDLVARLDGGDERGQLLLLLLLRANHEHIHDDRDGGERHERAGENAGGPAGSRGRVSEEREDGEVHGMWKKDDAMAGRTGSKN